MQSSPQGERPAATRSLLLSRSGLCSAIQRCVPSGRFVVPVTIGRAPPETDVSIATAKGCDTVTGVIDVGGADAAIACRAVFAGAAPTARHSVEHVGTDG